MDDLTQDIPPTSAVPAGNSEPSPPATVQPPADRPTDDEKWRQAVINEATQIQIAAAIWSDTLRERAAVFYATSSCIALISALLATAGGAFSLSDQLGLGGIFSLAAAFVASVSSVVAADRRTEEEKEDAAANSTLADAARVFATTVAPFAPREETERSFKELVAQRDEVVRQARVATKGILKSVATKLRERHVDESGNYTPSSTPVAAS